MPDKIPVQLYIRPVADAQEITAEKLALLPASRQERVRGTKHESTKAALFSAGLLLRDVLDVRKDEDLFFNGNGKPYLTSGQCFFSLSHDEAYVALATAPAEIGADVESRKELHPALIKRVFTEQERVFLEQNAVFNGIFLWTRLEASLKLSGQGISGLDERRHSLLEDSPGYCFETLTFGNSIVSIACSAKMSIQLRNAGT